MSSSGLKLCSCLCVCLLVTVNNIAILIGLLVFALGLVVTVGLNWVTSNSVVQELLKQLSELLKQQAHQDVDIQELIRSVGSLTGSVGIVFIILGIVLVVVSCLGCFGGCCKIRPCLIIYAICVGLLFLGQLTVVIIWYSNSGILKSSAKTAMERSVSSYTGFNSNNVESLLQNLLHIFLGCCGVNNGTDFHTLNNHWDRRFFINQGGSNFTFNLTYPVSCCKFDLSSMQPRSLYCPYNDTESNYQVGCYDKLFAGYIDKYFLNYLFPALAGILALQLLLVIGALVIYSSESGKNSNHRVKPFDRPV